MKDTPTHNRYIMIKRHTLVKGAIIYGQELIENAVFVVTSDNSEWTDFTLAEEHAKHLNTPLAYLHEQIAELTETNNKLQAENSFLKQAHAERVEEIEQLRNA